MTPSRFTGTPVSDGTAAGVLYVADVTSHAGASAEQVAAAFAAVAAERSALASQLRAAGRDQEADIVGLAALIAADSVLVNPAVAAVGAGVDAATAIRQSAEAQATVLAGLDSPELAERAGDVRQVAQAVLEQLAGGKPDRPGGDFILVRRDVAAADLIELADQGLAGAVTVAGGASSHAAIIARGLGVPMLAGVDEAVLTDIAGRPALLDSGAGLLTLDPPEAELAALARRRAATAQRWHAAQAAAAGHAATAGPACIADGHEVVILCNVASAAETRRGLAEGAAGVGPPFLSPGRSGLAELLSRPGALADQLRVAMTRGRHTELAILIPMVSTLAEVAIVRRAVDGIAAELTAPPAPIGIMVELASTAAAAETFASHADFFSIGTNDLTCQVLGLDRVDPSAGPGLAADPRVLELIDHVTAAAAAADISVSVCGDAAADLRVLPLLIGLGVRVVSVPAAKVGQVRASVSRLDTGACAATAAKALASSSAPENWELVHRADLS